MKIKNFLLLSLAAVAFAACDNISESERYGKDPVDVQKAKNVLIEDFTGQKCINCPKATDVIHELQGLYGEDHVIAVPFMVAPCRSPKRIRRVWLRSKAKPITNIGT